MPPATIFCSWLQHFLAQIFPSFEIVPRPRRFSSALTRNAWVYFFSWRLRGFSAEWKVSYISRLRVRLTGLSADLDGSPCSRFPRNFAVISVVFRGKACFDPRHGCCCDNSLDSLMMGTSFHWKSLYHFYYFGRSPTMVNAPQGDAPNFFYHSQIEKKPICIPGAR